MILGFGLVNSANESEYPESLWPRLGHPVFENDYIISLDDIEWWDIKKSESDDIINP